VLVLSAHRANISSLFVQVPLTVFSPCSAQRADRSWKKVQNPKRPSSSVELGKMSTRLSFTRIFRLLVRLVLSYYGLYAKTPR
jgi:hypothetical protein